MSLPMTWRSAGHHLANEVQVVREARPGDVVDQRVVPDVDRARLRVPGPVLALRRLAVRHRERDAPAGAGPADREVLEALADEAEHLVAPVVRLDEVGVLLVVALEQASWYADRRKNQFRSVSHWSGTSGWFGQIVPRAVSWTSVAFRKPSLGQYQPS